MRHKRFASIIGMAALAVVVLIGPAYAGLEDILYEKGQITKEEWLKAKADQEKAGGGSFEEWKKKVEKLPILSDKINIGVNALQVQYYHQDAHVAEGSAQDQFLVRRAEFIAWGKLMDQIPRWHILFDMASLGTLRTNGTAVCTVPTSATTCTTTNVVSAANHQILKEAYIDLRPVQSLAPYLDLIRIGQYRIPFGIETDTSSGVIDFISRGLFSSGASGGGLSSPTGVDFIQERDVYVNVKSKPFEFLELDAAVMNGNSIDSTFNDNNTNKDFLWRARVKPTKDLFFSTSGIVGESTNLNTALAGRGKGAYDRLGFDARYVPAWLPGLHLQAEWITGHDAPNQANSPTNVASSLPTTNVGVQRRTWYAYVKYRLDDLGVGFLKGWEPLIRYEEFDPNTSGITSNATTGTKTSSQDMFTRTTIGLNYYFAEMLPKIQTKLQLNYEFRHHQEGPGGANTATDQMGRNAFLIQFQVRWM